MRAVSIDRLREDLRSLYSPPLGSEATWKIYRQILDELSRFCGVKKTSDLTVTAVASWVRACPKGPKNAWKLLSALRHACNYCIHQNWLTASPFSFRPLDRWIPDLEADETGEKPDTRHHSLAELRALMVGLQAEALTSGCWRKHRLFALALTTLLTGCRAREVQCAKVEDFDLEAGWFRVRPNEARRLKTRKSRRDIPLPAEAVATLKRWLPMAGCAWAFPGKMRVAPWQGGTAGFKPLDQLKRACERFGLRPMRFRDFRHCYVEQSATGWGIPELVTQTITGHSQPSMTRQYRGFDRANLASAIAPICLGLPQTL